MIKCELEFNGIILLTVNAVVKVASSKCAILEAINFNSGRLERKFLKEVIFRASIKSAESNRYTDFHIFKLEKYCIKKWDKKNP